MTRFIIDIILIIVFLGDYVIEESSNPFPVNDLIPTETSELAAEVKENGISRTEKPINGAHSPLPALIVNASKKPNGESLKCDQCGKLPAKGKWKKRDGRRFCSVNCSRLFARVDIHNPVMEHLSDADFASSTDNNNSMSSIDTDRQSENSDVSERKRMRLSKVTRIDHSVSSLEWLSFIMNDAFLFRILHRQFRKMLSP